MHAEFNHPDLWRQAWDRLPLPRLMQAIGDGAHVNAPFGDTPKNKVVCPFCGAKEQKFAIFKRGSRHFFKCFIPECAANDCTDHDEIGYLSLRKNLSRKDAAREYLQLALPEAVLSEYTCDAQAMEPPAPRSIAGADKLDDRNIWHALWKKLTLRPQDREKLRQQRGFSDATIDALGFRSNHEGNRDALDQLAEQFGRDAVIAEGIFKAEGRYRPAGQLYGYGITGKDKPDGTPEFDITEPPLIPYLDEEGIPFYLRPHKGGVKRPRSDEDEDDLSPEDRPCDSHVYCPFTLAEMIEENDGLAVLTEGEFKVGALYQCHIPALAAPGISFLANPSFKRELIRLLERHNVTELVIIYDNEDKSSPTLPDGSPNPKFKADPKKRYETLVWAEFARRELRDHFIRVGGHVRVGWLPDEHRIDGKADFDSILAQQVRLHGLDKGTREARRIFLKAIKTAQDGDAPLDLFPDYAQRIIQNRLSVLRYRPLVGIGGEKERKLAARFYETDDTVTPPEPVDADLAAAFKRVFGCYWERRPVNSRIGTALRERLGELTTAIEEWQLREPSDERTRKLHFLKARKTAVFERLKGVPEDISNFTLRCEYKLHRADGTVDRLVRITDAKDMMHRRDRQLRRITPEDLSQGKPFRKWCLGTGEAVWKGGEKALQALCQDMDHHAFQQDIHEIMRFGYDPNSKMWFAGDCAYAPDGTRILPDASGILWHEGIGYTIDMGIDDRGTSAFAQGAPRFTAPHGAEPSDDETLRQLLGLADSDETPIIPALFRTFAQDLFDTIGDYDGFLALGMVIAYAAGPELVKQEGGGHPGAWLFGRMSSGKTTQAQLLMRVWGFKFLHDCLRLDQGSSPTGLNRAMAQYSSLPVLLDEYQHGIDPEKEAILKAGFDRSSSVKGIATADNRTRLATIFTTPLVSGEASSSLAALRSRYAHILVARARRLPGAPDRLNRMLAYTPHLYRIGDWLLSHRPEFVRQFLTTLESCKTARHWQERIPNDRIRYVHAVGYAAFHTTAVMLGIPAFAPSPEAGQHEPRTINAFQSWILTHANQALHDVQEETFMSHFWNDVITGISRGRIRKTYIQLRYAQRTEDGKVTICTHPMFEADGITTYQGKSYHQTDPARPIHVAYVALAEVFAEYCEMLQRRGARPPLSKEDLAREMTKEPYFIPPPPDNSRRHKLKIKGQTYTCTVLSLERDHSGSYAFPYAEDLINSIESEPEDSE